MKVNTLVTLAVLISGSSVDASDDFRDWVPEFNDRPVSEKLIKEIQAALPQEPIVAPIQPRKVLLFSATAGFRHKSIPAGKMALEMLGGASGAYETVVSDDPKYFEADALATFDAVILLSPTLNFLTPDKKQEDNFSDEELAWFLARHKRLVNNLVEYVVQGGGLMGIHAATDACYGHKEYGEMIGGYFAGHPWTWDKNVTIVIEDPEHATMAPVFGDKDYFELVEEIYQFRDPYSRERLRVLMSLDIERSDKVEKMNRSDNDYPVAWVQSVGEGRVFYTSIGHNEHIYANPLMLRHYLAGIQFATGDLDGVTTPSGKLCE
jgi:type 1 glutamine amidotransferase